MHSAFGDYKEKVTAVNAIMKNKTSEYIAKVLEFQAEFSKDILEHSVIEQEAFEKKIRDDAEGDGMVDEQEMDEDFDKQLTLLGEKEGMLEMLTQSKDFLEA